MPHSTEDSQSFKVCTRCHCAKPRSEFSRKAASSDGLLWWCKECYRRYREERKAAPKHIPEHKSCTKCGALKSAREFSKRADSRDGLSPWCKACQSDYHKEYSKLPRARELHRAACERYRNGEKGQATIKRYNREYNRRPEVKERRRKMQATEKYRRFKRGWHRRYPLKARANKLRRRAREYNAPGSHTADDIRLILRSQKGRCWYCQAEITADNMHIDHRVPLSRGGTNAPENLVATCPACNLSKNDRLPHEWNGRLL